MKKSAEYKKKNLLKRRLSEKKGNFPRQKEKMDNPLSLLNIVHYLF